MDTPQTRSSPSLHAIYTSAYLRAAGIVLLATGVGLVVRSRVQPIRAIALERSRAPVAL